MSQQTHEQIDAEVIQSLRELLRDTDASNPQYSDALLVDTLRDHRRTVLYRDPGYASSGVNPYLWYRGKVHVPPTDPDYSLLQAEPDRLTFQAHRFCRHWDSLQPVRVWQNGVAKTLTTDYTVSFAEGRITFTYTVNDWETVNASFCYYRLYHAARQCVLGRLSQPTRLHSWKEGDVAEMYDGLRDLLSALDAMIGEMIPANVRWEKRWY